MKTLARTLVTTLLLAPQAFAGGLGGAGNAVIIGPMVSGHCVQSGGSVLLKDAGAACGSGSGGITNIATTGPITGGPITSTGTIGITQSTTSTDGYLSSTDWNTFNGKLSPSTAASTYVPYSGATGNVDLGAHTIKATSLITNGGTSGQFVKGDGSLDSGAYLTSVGIANLTATGTPSSSTYLRGDNTWATVSGGGLTIGAPISGGTNTGILYQDDFGNLGNNGDFTYSPGNRTFTVGFTGGNYPLGMFSLADSIGTIGFGDNFNSVNGTKALVNDSLLAIQNFTNGTYSIQDLTATNGLTINIGTLTAQSVGITSWDFGGAQISNIADPVSAQDAVTLNYANAAFGSVASVNLAARSTQIINTTSLFTPTVTGFYKIFVYLQVTQAASTSSILGGSTGVTLKWTDGDGNVAQTNTMALTSKLGTVVTNDATNTTTTNLSGVQTIYAASGVNVKYGIGYTSVGATVMKYTVHIRVQSL